MADTKNEKTSGDEEKEEILEKKGKEDATSRAEPETKSEQGEPLLDEPIKITDYLYLMILTLEGKAWAYLDLVPHPETRKHRKDLDEAKKAIDTIDMLYKIIEEDLNDEQKKDMQTRLTNLRLNFVKK